jgi:predicted PurR-regulated permease PerM
MMPSEHGHAPAEGPVPPVRDGRHEPARTRKGYFSNVPFANILATIGMVLGIYGTLLLLSRTTKILTWLLVAAFFAVVLTPPVNWLVKNLHMPRALAATLVFIVGIACISAMGYVFIRPLAKEGQSFAKDFPTYVKDAQEGRGEVGKLVKRWKVDQWLEKNQDELQTRAQKLFSPNKVLGTTVGALGSAFGIAAAVLTTLVLTFLMLVQGEQLLTTATFLLAPHQRERLHRLGQGAAKAITGYVAGNLAISVIAGVATFAFGLIADLPFAAVLALWVAFADLIPLVGATMGAIPMVIVAFLYSTPVGIAAVIFYVIYQQFENQVLQPMIMAKTVSLKPLVVLVSVLIGVEMLGLLGALLAIPAAAIVKVIGADVVAHRRPGWVETEDARLLAARNRLRRSSDAMRQAESAARQADSVARQADAAFQADGEG